MLKLSLLFVGTVVTLSAGAQTPDALARIRDEGMNRSQVMQTLSYLTDVIGPRLTGTPACKRANEWTRDEMSRIGLQNAHLEPWGPFGRGWTLESFTAEMTAPTARPLEAYPKAWSPSVDVKDGEVVQVIASTPAELEKYKGKLKGKVVLNGKEEAIKPHFDPEGSRLSEKELLEMANAHIPAASSKTDAPDAKEVARRHRSRQAYLMRAARAEFFLQEAVALVLDPSRAGDGGNIFVQQASTGGKIDTSDMNAIYKSGIKPWDPAGPPIVPQCALALEQFNRLARMIALGQQPKVTVHLAARYETADQNGYNTLAELPGTDKKQELVMLGGHLDSWHGGTGATDNGAGVAVCMEAMRILKACSLQPRRTIRIGLWTGEEQGLFGSEAYVKAHFGEVLPESSEATGKSGRPAEGLVRVAARPEWARLSAYYNLDNGAGKVRGIYLQANQAAGPVFRPWLAPFQDLGASTITERNTGGTDHLSFDEVGLPGFQFIQDELEYDTRTHHSTQDVYDRVPPEDLKQCAVLMATFVYQTAMREQMIPRKPVMVVKVK